MAGLTVIDDGQTGLVGRQKGKGVGRRVCLTIIDDRQTCHWQELSGNEHCMFSASPATLLLLLRGIAMKTGISLAERQSLAAKLVVDFTGGTSGATLSLFQNNITPTPLTALTDFVESSFTGYARKTAITAFVTFNDAPSGDQIVTGTALQLFAATAGVTPQIAYGWYLQDAALAVLLAWGKFDVGYPFNAAGDKLEVVPVVRLPPGTGQTN